MDYITNQDKDLPHKATNDKRKQKEKSFCHCIASQLLKLLLSIALSFCDNLLYEKAYALCLSLG